MNSITVDGKNYIKAGVIARELGYTGDYVGQLCRAGKVDAQLVGRSWYVEEDSIHDHKKDRYRSNKKTAISSVQKHIAAESLDTKDSYRVAIQNTQQVSEGSSAGGYADQSFYTRAKREPVPSYQSDETDLIPAADNSHKVGRIGVRLADAHNISIKSKKSTFDFDPTQRPVLRFKGKVSVSDYEDELDEEEVDDDTETTLVRLKVAEEDAVSKVAVHKKDVSNQATNAVLSDKASKIKVIHKRPSSKNTQKDKNLPLEHNSEGVLSMQRGRITSRNPMGGTLKVGVQSNKVVSRTGGTLFVVVTTLAAVIVSVLLSTLEQNLYVIGNEVVTQYTLDVDDLIASAYDTFR